MQIRTGEFYKAKDNTPGGYLYVTEAGAEKITFTVCEGKELPEKAGTFTVTRADFERIAETE